jgi:hypothetical protein
MDIAICRVEEGYGDNSLKGSFLIFCVFVVNTPLFMALFGKVLTVWMKTCDLHEFQARLTLYRYIEKHDLSSEGFLLMLKSLQFQEDRRRLEDEQVRESEVLGHFPADVQLQIYFEVRGPPLRNFAFMNEHDVRKDEHFLQMLCHEAITDFVCFAEEVVFEEGQTSNGMICIEMGKLVYCLGLEYKKSGLQSGRGKAVAGLMQHSASVDASETGTESKGTETELLASEHQDDTVNIQTGDILCEASLWTTWKHRGDLLPMTNGTLLLLDTKRFAHHVVQRTAICCLAVQYARQCVCELNHPHSMRSDLHTFALGVHHHHGSHHWQATDHHLIFLSHYKVEAGTEATLMMEELVRMIKDDLFNAACNFELPVFVDSEGLDDLNTLCDHVVKSHNLVVLLTPHVFSRVWCLIEIVTAWRTHRNIVPVEVQRPGVNFQYPDDEFYRSLRNAINFSEADVELLLSMGITFQDVEECVREVFMKIAKPYSPHKSQAVRSAELSNMLKRCPCHEDSSFEDTNRSMSKGFESEDAEDFEGDEADSSSDKVVL